MVVIEGESGFGKTALVHAFLAGESGWITAAAVADDGECAVTYGVIEQIADELAHAGAAAAADVDMRDNGIRQVAASAVAALDAVGGPVCIVVDDAQWVDEDSAGVLMLLAHAVRHRAVLLVISARRDASPLLNRVRRLASGPGRGAVVHVGALSPREVQELVEVSLATDYSLRSATTLAAYAQGCPLDIQAAVEACGGDPARAHDQLTRYVPDLVESLRTVLSQVTDSCRLGVELMAVLDAPTSVADLDAVAVRLGGLVDVPAAMDVHLLEIENSRGVLTVRPLHARVRDAVLAAMDRDAIRRVHTAIADGAVGPRALLHRAAACVDGSEELAAHLEEQASGARAHGDLDRAVEYGLWATRLTTDPGAYPRRLVDCAASSVAGRHLRVFDELVGGLESLAPTPERDLLLAYSQLRRGDNAAARERAASALAADLCGEPASTALRIVVTCGLASALAVVGELAEVATLCDVLERDLSVLVAERSADRADDGIPVDLLGREIELSALRSAVAHYTEGIAVHRSPVAKLLDALAPGRYDGRHAIALVTRGTLLHKDGQLHRAAEDLTSGLSLIADDASWVAQQGRIELAMVQFRLGSWDDAQANAADALDLALDRGDPWSTAAAYAVAALVPVGRGDLAVAERRLGLAHAAMSESGTLVAYRVIALVEMMLALARRRPERALTAMQAYRVHADLGDRVGNWDAAEAVALLELGRIGEAAAALARFERTDAEYLLVRGAVSFMAGERDRAARQLRGALAALDDDSSVIVRGVTWHRVGMLLAVDGEPDAGRALIRRARDLYGRLGAARWLAECEADLRALDAAPMARSTSQNVSSETSLTVREHQIALLVGEGLTNREVAERLTLSIRTVDFHLRNVLHKLGFGSRRQLRGWAAAAATSRTVPDPGDESPSGEPHRSRFRTLVLGVAGA
ncbi:ATP-, maltotriose-and DNA-dependent transcriptional regulator MalT [Rhodococcus tukisamuensis]|uniref:ATP-, maltotriose-and DNA-dependent transcriptional regulator MalT n=1 Tax=Rhodococcus tukisamuensis TaxID=168276 RepID=A0A1G7BRC4_9NOCA|nr:ATP-, maltotriose-and DNA-dependent transcriptional regulator MalT [Rhodococcus tukisamuensis]